MSHDPGMRYEAQAISARLGGRTILADLDFDATAGEVTVIAGPNGSGKTTLIKALSGELPVSGQVSINGRPLGTLKPWQFAAMRAVLPQEIQLAFPFTVDEVVSLGISAGIHGGSDKENRRRVLQALTAVDLSGFSGRLYQELSGGERQRVQLARVLCQIWEPVAHGEPRWLLMDEPVASLDIRHQIGLMEIARSYARRGGGVIAVMHDLNLSAMFADRIVLMKNGRVAALGTPAEVFDAKTLQTVFDCAVIPGIAPENGNFILPQSIA
ncbi:heme ABC transporter ATP-binding protein [Rhizobium sp. PAMB 3174]